MPEKRRPARSPLASLFVQAESSRSISLWQLSSYFAGHRRLGGSGACARSMRIGAAEDRRSEPRANDLTAAFDAL